LTRDLIIAYNENGDTRETGIIFHRAGPAYFNAALTINKLSNPHNILFCTDLPGISLG